MKERDEVDYPSRDVDRADPPKHEWLLLLISVVIFIAIFVAIGTMGK